MSAASKPLSCVLVVVAKIMLGFAGLGVSAVCGAGVAGAGAVVPHPTTITIMAINSSAKAKLRRSLSSFFISFFLLYMCFLKPLCICVNSNGTCANGLINFLSILAGSSQSETYHSRSVGEWLG